MEVECWSVSLAVPLTFSQLVSVSPAVRLFLDLTCSWVCVSHRVLCHRRRCPLEVCLALLFSMPASIAGRTGVRLPCWHVLFKSPLLLPLCLLRNVLWLTLLLLYVYWGNLSVSMDIFLSSQGLGDITILMILGKIVSSYYWDPAWILYLKKKKS